MAREPFQKCWSEENNTCVSSAGCLIFTVAFYCNFKYSDISRQIKASPSHVRQPIIFNSGHCLWPHCTILLYCGIESCSSSTQRTDYCSSCLYGGRIAQPHLVPSASKTTLEIESYSFFNWVEKLLRQQTPSPLH